MSNLIRMTPSKLLSDITGWMVTELFYAATGAKLTDAIASSTLLKKESALIVQSIFYSIPGEMPHNQITSIDSRHPR